MPRRFDSVIPGASRSSRDCRPGPSDRPNSKGCHTLIQGWPSIMEARGKACGRPALRAPCIISGKTRSEQIYGNRRSGQTRPRADKCNVLLGKPMLKSSARFGANDLNGLRSSILNIVSCVAYLGRCRLPHQNVYSKRRKSSLSGKLNRAPIPL